MWESGAFERFQQERTLNHILYATGGAALLLSLLNFLMNYPPGAVSLLALAFLCLVSLWLNRCGFYLLASILLSGSVLATMHYNFLAGNGLRDPGIVAYPGLILLGTLLFGKRATPYFLLLSAVSILLIAGEHLAGHIPIERGAGIDTAVKMLILLASSTALVFIIVDNLQRYLDRLKQSERDLRQAYEMTLEGWAKALEYRDKETEGHSRRVTETSLRLARILGCSEEDLVQIRHGALLHDIGKIAIPDSILLKPGPLDDAEREVMEQHPVLAKELLGNIDFLRPALAIPYCHHERWDGKGYPEGLKGEEIPLFARIFTVVDQWDALSSTRPYRKAWSQERIIAYLEDNRGKIFDPVVVDYFVEMLRLDDPSLSLHLAEAPFAG